MKQPVALIILDGWGHRTEPTGNAVLQAHTPVFDALWESGPRTLLNTTGEAVGLPAGVMGNSEVGHMNLGAGRVVYQSLSRINRAIAAGELATNRAWSDTVARVGNGTLHIMGLISDGGVHSHIEHIEALIAAEAAGVARIRVHAFTDGRDTAPQGGAAYLERLQAHCAQYADAKIATVCGRYFAMDRDRRWERTQRAYDLLVSGVGARAESAVQAAQDSYAAGTTDEFIEPVCIDPDSCIGADDVLVFANFRGDRARQIVTAFADPDFGEFARPVVLGADQLLCMTQYHEAYPHPVMFAPLRLEQKFGDVVSAAGKTQLRIAETEKYAHVTFFFNGGEDGTQAGEQHCLVPSPQDVPTYDHKPEMSAEQVAAQVVEHINNDCPDTIICNFANPDMVGHTGVISAAVAAVECVDRCLGEVLRAITARGGVALVTADHGNAEEMLTPAGTPHTAHTTNLVPCVLVGADSKYQLRAGGKLADVAPTLLELLGLKQPEEMTGESLLGR